MLSSPPNNTISNIQFVRLNQLEDRVVGYLDILGFSQAMGSCDEDIANKALMLAQLLYHYDRRTEFLKTNRLLPDGSNYQDAQPEITVVSDSILISTPYPSDIRHRSFRLATITGFLSMFQMKILEHGFLSRGGIAGGKALHKGHLFVGPAVVGAVSLEKESKVPAVIVCPQLLKWVKEEFVELYNSQFAERDNVWNSSEVFFEAQIALMGVQNEEDYSFVNYFVGHMGPNYLENIHRILQHEINKSCKSSEKWGWAVKKFNKMINRLLEYPEITKVPCGVSEIEYNLI